MQPACKWRADLCENDSAGFGANKMDHLHIGTRRWYYVAMLIGALGFVLGGIFLVSLPGAHNQLAGWPAIIFFSGCAVIFIQQIVDARPRLVIDNSGIYDRTLRIGVIPWEDITGAYVKHVQNQPFICLNLVDADRYIAKMHPLARALVKANTAMGFEPVNLNLSGVQTDPEAVCALILHKIE